MSRHYVDNASFERSILEGDREAVASTLRIIAERVCQMKAPVIPPELDLDDMAQECVIDALRRVETKWNGKQGSAFLYASYGMKMTIASRVRAVKRYSARFLPWPDTRRAWI